MWFWQRLRKTEHMMNTVCVYQQRPGTHQVDPQGVTLDPRLRRGSERRSISGGRAWHGTVHNACQHSEGAVGKEQHTWVSGMRHQLAAHEAQKLQGLREAKLECGCRCAGRTLTIRRAKERRVSGLGKWCGEHGECSAYGREDGGGKFDGDHYANVRGAGRLSERVRGSGNMGVSAALYKSLRSAVRTRGGDTRTVSTGRLEKLEKPAERARRGIDPHVVVGDAQRPRRIHAGVVRMDRGTI